MKPDIDQIPLGQFTKVHKTYMKTKEDHEDRKTRLTEGWEQFQKGAWKDPQAGCLPSLLDLPFSPLLFLTTSIILSILSQLETLISP